MNIRNQVSPCDVRGASHGAGALLLRRRSSSHCRCFRTFTWAERRTSGGSSRLSECEGRLPYAVPKAWERVLSWTPCTGLGHAIWVQGALRFASRRDAALDQQQQLHLLHPKEEVSGFFNSDDLSGKLSVRVAIILESQQACLVRALSALSEDEAWISELQGFLTGLTSMWRSGSL